MSKSLYNTFLDLNTDDLSNIIHYMEYYQNFTLKKGSIKAYKDEYEYIEKLIEYFRETIEEINNE